MKTVKDCKNVSIMSLQVQPYAVKTNKQNVNIADENLTDYSFLSYRYHYTKSKIYLKRRYLNRLSIPMFIGTPCING